MSYEPWKPRPKVHLPKPPLTQQEKLRRFLMGFLGWFLVTTLVWVAAARLGGGETLFNCMLQSGFGFFLLAIVLTATRYRWVGLGILGEIATNTVIDLILAGHSGGLIGDLGSMPFIVYFLP